MKNLVQTNTQEKSWSKKKFFNSEITKNEFFNKQQVKNFKQLNQFLSIKVMNFLNIQHKSIYISILLTNNETIANLNYEFRQKNYPTNILSFPYLEEIEIKNLMLNTLNLKDVCLGELIIAWEKVLEESIDQQIHFIDHYCHLMIHGVLHLLGYDHENNEYEARKMENLEIEILSTINVANPYK